MTKREMAWVGGFFDGEGYIGIHHTHNGRGGSSKTLHVAITQKDRTPLDWIKKKFNFGKVSLNTASGCYYWTCYSRFAQSFGRRILPYLRTKHKIQQTVKALKVAKTIKFMTYARLKNYR